MMTLKRLVVYGVALAVALLCYMAHRNARSPSTLTHPNSSVASRPVLGNDTIHVAIVVCGGRLLEGLLAIKSIWLSCPLCKLHFYVFTDSEEKADILTLRLNYWRHKHDSFEFTIKEASFIDEQWKNLFRPCASLRLFAHMLVNGTDWLLYLDSDTLAVASIQELWDTRLHFSSRQIIGASVESYAPSTYSRKSKSPYVQPAGINSGVLLMNLARIRSMNWLQTLQKYYSQYKDVIRYGDQCLLNALFHFQPELLYLLPPYWNTRTDFCVQCARDRSVEMCKTFRPRILHGNRRVFHDRFIAREQHAVYAKLFQRTALAVAKSRMGQSVKKEVDEVERQCFAACPNITLC